MAGRGTRGSRARSSASAAPPPPRAPSPAAATPDAVDWSQARYLDYAYVTVDVVPPAGPGQATTMTLRAITDIGQEIDRVVLERRSR